MTDYIDQEETEQRGVVSARNPLDGTKAEIVARPNNLDEWMMEKSALIDLALCGKVTPEQIKMARRWAIEIYRQLKFKRKAR